MVVRHDPSPTPPPCRRPAALRRPAAPQKRTAGLPHSTIFARRADSQTRPHAAVLLHRSCRCSPLCSPAELTLPCLPGAGMTPGCSSTARTAVAAWTSSCCSTAPNSCPPPPPQKQQHTRACRPPPLRLRSSGRWGHHTSIASRSLTFEVRPFVVRPYRPAHLPPGLHQSTAQQQADPRAAMHRCCSWVPDFYFPPSVRHSIGAKNDGQVRPHSSSLQGWVSASAGSTSGGGGGSRCTVFLQQQQQQQQQRVAFRMDVSNSSTLSHPSARVSADRYLPQRKCPLEPAASPHVELQGASLGPPWALPSAACPKQQDGEAGPGS